MYFELQLLGLISTSANYVEIFNLQNLMFFTAVLAVELYFGIPTYAYS